MTKVRHITAHFNSAADRREALAKLQKSEYPGDPVEVAILVKQGKIASRHVHEMTPISGRAHLKTPGTVHIKVGGMSRARKPKEEHAKPFRFKLGSPFITSTNGPTILAQIANEHRTGFRSPSKKAKNWLSTSLVEQVMKVELKFERSARGDKKAKRDAQARALALATQDIRNLADKYLSPAARARKKLMPPLAKADTVAIIRESYMENMHGAQGPVGALGQRAAA